MEIDNIHEQLTQSAISTGLTIIGKELAAQILV